MVAILRRVFLAPKDLTRSDTVTGVAVVSAYVGSFGAKGLRLRMTG